MKKYTVFLMAAFLLAGCSSNSQDVTSVESSSTSIQSSASKSSTSSNSMASKASTQQDSAAGSNSKTVSASSAAEAGAMDVEDAPVSQAAIADAGTTLVAGDFSTIAGTWVDEYGNQLIVDGAGNVHVEMAAGSHIPEEARGHLTRDLYLDNNFASFDGTYYEGVLANDAHTSGLPRLSVNTEDGTVRLVNEYAETYSGTFTKVQ